MTAPDARQSEELREALARALETVWHQKTPRGKDRPATRDEVLDALTPVAESLARERAAEELRAAADELRGDPNMRAGGFADYAAGRVRARAAARLRADDQPVQP